MSCHVCVVGDGAAGLTGALRAAEFGARVTLLNAHPKIGLKILMSGGTRCNVTHRVVTERDFNGGSRHFVARVLRAFSPEQTLEWFTAMGVALKLEETGKYFPETDDAATVLDALMGAVAGAGVEVRNGARVVRIERDDARFRLGVQTIRNASSFHEVSAIGRSHWDLLPISPDLWLEADAVVVATGGLSFPRTGSDGTGYSLVESLGHTLEPTTPALTPLAAEDPLCADAQGVTLEAELSLWRGTKREVTVRGSFLIAHFGYSGPVALDLSRHWLRATVEERARTAARERAGDALRVTANFVPGVTREALLKNWLAAAGLDARRSVRRFVGDLVPDRLAVVLAREAAVDPAMSLSQVSKSARTALIGHIVERELPITGTLGYEKAEATAGGVRLSEVNPSTLESRLVPGLFLCGELLDVEGRLGGFNFQWAWSSGTIAGRAAATR